MTQAEAKRLEQFKDSGYLILIHGSGYIDGPVDSIYEDEEEGSETKGELVYDSDVFSGQPLSKVHLHDVEVYRPVSFKHAQIEYVEGQGDEENYDDEGNFIE